MAMAATSSLASRERDPDARRVAMATQISELSEKQRLLGTRSFAAGLGLLIGLGTVRGEGVPVGAASWTSPPGDDALGDSETSGTQACGLQA